MKTLIQIFLSLVTRGLTGLLLICAGAPLVLVAAAFQSGVAANLSTVEAAELPVYSQASQGSPVIKTLRQGDRVIIELEITSGGLWCRIREVDQAKSSGYVLCAQLDRPQQSDQKRWGSSSPQSSSAADGATPPKKADVASPATKPDDRRSLRDPEFWADRFKFSDEQRQRSSDLQQNSGLAACRDRVEQMYRANGISDPASLLKAMGSMGWSASGMARAGRLGAELDRCGASYGSFWKKFVDLLNPKQKTQLANEPYLILFLTQTLSDPSTEFGSYVLSQMNPR